MRKYNIGECLIVLTTMLYLGSDPLTAIATSIIIYIIREFQDKPSKTNKINK